MLDLLTQLILGFTIALTGALIPGPLSVFIVTNVVKSGNRSAGLLAALGHCLVEVGIIGAIVLGLTTVFQSSDFQFAVNVVGGGALIVFGALSIRERKRGETEIRSAETGHSALLGGVVFSVFNATILLWWATTGLMMLSQALITTTMLGVLFWVLGHWLADIVWFSFLGYSVHRGKRYVSSKTNSRIITLCGVVMISLGLFFVYQSVF